MINLIHWLAAIVVLAEALNKLERANPLASGLTRHLRALEWAKITAWSLLAIGAGCGVAAPIVGELHMRTASVADTFSMLGVAALIIYTRAREPQNERRNSI